MDARLLGIDIGGTKSAVILGTPHGELLDRVSFPTEQERGPDHAIEKLLNASGDLLNRRGGKLAGIGIACGSPLNPETGIIQSPPNLPTWTNVPIVKIFQDRFATPTFLDNDANAGALAEFVFGAGRGFRNIVFITFGTGCGSGLILDGRMYRGTNCYAGEVGHIRLADDGPIGYHKRGSFEGFCSGGGIAQLAADIARGGRFNTLLTQSSTAEDVAKAARAGDAGAIQVLEVSGYHLGKGISYLLDILNPERIIIGSIFVRCEALLRPKMEEAIKEEALEYTRSVCEIVPAGLGEKIGDFAAISVAQYGLNLRSQPPI